MLKKRTYVIKSEYKLKMRVFYECDRGNDNATEVKLFVA